MSILLIHYSFDVHHGKFERKMKGGEGWQTDISSMQKETPGMAVPKVVGIHLAKKKRNSICCCFFPFSSQIIVFFNPL